MAWVLDKVTHLKSNTSDKLEPGTPKGTYRKWYPHRGVLNKGMEPGSNSPGTSEDAENRIKIALSSDHEVHNVGVSSHTESQKRTDEKARDEKWQGLKSCDAKLSTSWRRKN